MSGGHKIKTVKHFSGQVTYVVELFKRLVKTSSVKNFIKILFQMKGNYKCVWGKIEIRFFIKFIGFFPHFTLSPKVKMCLFSNLQTMEGTELQIFMWFSRDFDWIKNLLQTRHWLAVVNSIPLSLLTQYACLINDEK